MRGLKSTLALIVVLGGLGAYIYFVESQRPANTFDGSAPKQKVFDVESDKIEEIRLTADSKETSLLRKVDGTWRLIEPVQADADQTEVTSLTTNIPTLEVNHVVDENATDLAQYGLAEPRIRVAFKGQNNVAGELLIGERTATQNDLYAVKPGEKRVFLVSSFHDTTFNKKPFDLRDKRVLTVKRDDIDLLEIASGAETLQLGRSGTEWAVKRPVQARGDYSAVEGLVSRITTANMMKLVEQGASGTSLSPEVLAKYGLDKPVVTLTVGAGSSRATLQVGKEEEGATYARDLSRPMVFTIDSSVVTDLKKSADEYRNKNVFEFRSFNVARLRVVRGADAYEFQKVTGSGPNESDKWQRVVDGNATDLDTTKMDDFVSKVSNLRIQSFGPAAPAAAPAIVVSASYDGGKFERVRLFKTEKDALATRDGEPGAGRLDTANYDDAVKAFEAVLAPPPAKTS